MQNETARALIDVRTYPMPPRVATLPRDPRGYPIFFTIQQSYGQYNFLAVSPDQIKKCADNHLCGICGEPLNYWIHFVGGEISCETREFTEPPMHLTCLEYAMAVCPYLSRETYERNMERKDRVPRNRVLSDPHATPLAPGRFAIYRTRSYKFFIDGNRIPIFYAAPAREIAWREIKDHGTTEAETGSDTAL